MFCAINGFLKAIIGIMMVVVEPSKGKNIIRTAQSQIFVLLSLSFKMKNLQIRLLGISVTSIELAGNKWGFAGLHVLARATAQVDLRDNFPLSSTAINPSVCNQFFCLFVSTLKAILKRSFSGKFQGCQ